MNKKSYFILILIIMNIILLFSCIIGVVYLNFKEDKVRSLIKNTTTKPKETKILINAVGDCTIGYDDNFGYSRSFIEMYDLNNYDYFFSNVKHIFDKDDITIANLEGTFTDSIIKKEKKFNFKAPKHYVNILKNGSIELVNIANNHIYDYNEEGKIDTINALNDAEINYFGFDETYIYQKDNIKIGFAGIYCIEDRNCTLKIDYLVEKLSEENVNTIILSFHWGIEKSYKQSDIQTYLAHYAIDKGVELVLGHHPHVLQGIELYKGKYIVYSLANFSFGGNQNPDDKDTMIFNISFSYLDGVKYKTEVNIYPTSVSSLNNKNDYRPTLLEGSEYNRVLDKIENNSVGISFP